MRPHLVPNAADLHVVLIVSIVAVRQCSHGHLVAVGVHGGQDVDAGGVDEALNALISNQVLGAQVLSQVDQQLATQDLIPVNVANVLDLRLNCRSHSQR